MSNDATNFTKKLAQIWEIRKIAQQEAYKYYYTNIDSKALKFDPKTNTYIENEGFGRDDKLDAFRHAYVSAIFTLEFGENFAYLAGWGNELGRLSQFFDGSVAWEMDTFNNAKGREYAYEYARKLILEINGVHNEVVEKFLSTVFIKTIQHFIKPLLNI